MTIPTGSFSASDLNIELRRQWNQPLDANDAQLRSIISRGPGQQANAGEFRGRNLYDPYGYVYYYNVCLGVNKANLVADGNGGSFFQITEYNSITCGYVPPQTGPQYPPQGTLLEEYCSAGHLIGRYADGRGGSYDEVRVYNSPTCSHTGDNGGG